MKKRTLALLLSTSMAVTALSACGAKTEETAAAPTTKAAEQKTEAAAQATTAAPAPEVPEEPVEINWLGAYASNVTIKENTQTELLLEERFNVKLNPMTEATKDTMETYIGSGDILNATVFCTYLYSDLEFLDDQELIREIPEEWLYEYYPTGMKILEDFLGKEYFEKGNHLTHGKVMNVPWARTYDSSQTAMVYRKDWLDKLGLEVPKTLDELHDVLYAFTYNDPDGNGKDDTYGISCVMQNAYYLWPVFGAFGVSAPASFQQQEDGSVIYTWAQEEYRQALELMKAWYDEGLIDPECVSDDRNAMRAKWAAGTLGMIPDDIAWCNRTNATGIVPMVESVYGEGSVGLLTTLTSQYGDGDVYTFTKFPNTTTNFSAVFTASATDEQVIAVLKMLEGMASDVDLLNTCKYGILGTDYELDADGKVYTDERFTTEYQAERGLGNTFFALAVDSPEARDMTLGKRALANLEQLGTSKKIPYTSNFYAESETYDTYKSELKATAEEYYSHVLLGQKNLDSDWTAYLEALESLGLSKMIEEYEAALK